METCKEAALWGRATTLVGQRSSSHPEEYARIRRLVERARVFWHTIGTDQAPDDAQEVLQELRQLLWSVDIEIGSMATLTAVPSMSHFSGRPRE